MIEHRNAEQTLRDSEERQAFLLRLSDALRPLADPIASQEVAVRLLGTQLDVDRCYYAEFDWPRDVLYIHHEFTRSGAVSAIGAHPISLFKDLLVQSHKGEPLACDDIMTHPVFGGEAAGYRERGTDAFILVPLVKQGTMVACMCVTMEDPRHWSSSDIGLVQETAERTWAAVERARAEDALRESEERQRFLLALSDALRPLFDPAEIQRTACRVLGERTGASRVLYSDVYDEKEVVITNNYVNGVSPITVRLNAEEFGLDLIAAYKRGERVVFSDAASDPRFTETERRNFAALDIAANVSLGLVKGGKWIAAFGIHNATPREWTPLELTLVEETAERTWAAVERARAEARLAEELTDTQQLQRLSSTLITGDGDGSLYDQVLGTARTLMHAEMASLQRFVPGRRALFLLGHHGFHAESAQFWQWVDTDHASSCGLAMASAGLVVVPDVEQCGPLAGTDDLLHYRRCGVRAVLSAPLFARDGQMVGMISTHWREVHHPSERERRLLDLLSRQVADLLERRTMIDALRESEQRQAFLLALSDALRPARDTGTIQSIAARMLREQLRVDRCVYAEVVVEGGEEWSVVQPEHTAEGFPKLVGRHPVAAFGPVVQQLREGRDVVVPDTEAETEPDSLRQAYRSLGVRARLGVPLVKDGRLVGVLGVHHAEPRAWTADEVALVREVAERTWAAVERARAEEALRKSEEEHRSLFATMGQGYALCEMIRDGDGRAIDLRYIELNPAFERLTGVTIAQARGRTGREVYSSIDSFWLEAYDSVIRQNEPRYVERQFEPTGTWHGVFIYPAEGDRIIALFENITERKREEQRQQFILTLNDALRPLSDAAHIETTACRVLGEHLGVSRVYYPEVHEADGYSIIEREYLRDGAASLKGKHPLPAYDWAVQLLRRDGQVVMNDIYHADFLSQAEVAAMESLGQISAICVPLIKHGVLIGTLTVSDGAPRAWKPEDVELARETLERMSAAAQRARAEAALRASEERQGLAIDIGEFASWDWDLASNVVAWNDRHYLMQGYTVGEVTPSFDAWLARVHPEDRETTVARIDRARTTRDTYVHDFRSLHADGSVHWLSARGRFFYNGDGEAYRMVGVMEDVTDQKDSVEALRQSEAELEAELRCTAALRDLAARMVTEGSVAAIYEEILSTAVAITRSEGGTVQVYDPDTKSLSLLVTHAMPRHMTEYFHRVDAGSNTACGIALRTGQRTFVDFDKNEADEACRMHVDAGFRTAQATPLLSRDGSPIGMINTHWRASGHRPSEDQLRFLDLLARQASDLIEQRRAEQSLRESEERLRTLNERLEERVRERTSEVRSLFQRLVSAQEEERRRIARDIHDQVGQQMTALRMNLETLRSQATGHTALLKQAERTQRLAEELDQSIDFLTWQLRPSALDHLGLSAALQNLVTGWSQRFGVSADVAVDGVEDVRLPRDIEANLYRIAQEALHNIAKHAGATQVMTYLMEQDGHLTLLVEDNGRGFDPNRHDFSDDGKGMGLLNMRERAALVGGRLDIESRDGHGTSVYVRIPHSMRVHDSQ